MTAGCMNARWGRWENFWSAEEVCVTELLTREAIIDKLVYAAANPVKDHLVERASQWPGVNGYVHLLSGRPLRARRPHHFFRNGGVMVVTSTPVRFLLPPALNQASKPFSHIRENGPQALQGSQAAVAPPAPA
jgi:hypothetical protein